MRAKSKNPWETPMREAVKRADANRRRSEPGRGASPTPVTSSTVEGDDGSTLHPFMLGVDALGASDASLTGKGIEYQYLT